MACARASAGSVGACTRVKITTSTKTSSKIHSTSGARSITGTVARTTGTAPRKPAQDKKACSRRLKPNQDTDASTDSGRAINNNRPIARFRRYA